VRKLVDGGVLLVIFTCFLFVVSTVYHNRYYLYFRLDPDILERSFHQTIYHGFLVIWTDLLNSILTMSLVCFTLLLIVLSLPSLHQYFTEKSKEYNELKKLVSTLKLMFFTHQFEGRLIKTIKYFLKSIIILGIIALFLTKYLLTIEVKAKNNAHIDYISLKPFNQTNNTPIPNLTTVRINNENKMLYLLICGSRYCAGLEPKNDLDHRVFYFSVNSVLSYSYNSKLNDSAGNSFLSNNTGTLTSFFIPLHSNLTEYNQIFKEVKPIIYEWNLFTKKVNFSIQPSRLHSLVKNFKDINHVNFGASMGTHYFYHLARLNLILGDVTNDLSHIELALNYIEKAESYSEGNIVTLNSNDRTYFKDLKISDRINLTKYNILILALIQSNNEKYLLAANKQLKLLGGCSKFKLRNVVHKDLVYVLNEVLCKNN